MTRLFVDADACPVKEEIYRVAERYGLHVYVVSNGWMNTRRAAFIEQVVVDAGPDIADDWIAERAGGGDVVITADIPLAERCLKAGAQALRPNGQMFTADSIGSALAGKGQHAGAFFRRPARRVGAMGGDDVQGSGLSHVRSGS